MLLFRCDRCGRELPKGALRYDVTIEVKAAYDELEVRLTDLVRDHRDEIVALIAAMDRAGAESVEDGVYKRFALHLCPACQRAYLAAPLAPGPAPEGATPVDIDGFLRSLGIPPGPGDSPDGAD